MKGFTLIETLLYIALLSMLLTGGVTTAFQLLKSTSTDSSQLASYDETVFVLQKISWVLSQE
jgi:type II secretory pathway pseudopilin PulG